VLGGVFGVLAWTAVARAQVAPPAAQVTEMQITVPEVEVRSGGGPNFYGTLQLHQGDRVQVLGQSKKFSGWLEIKPPPGSFSWVNQTYLKVTGEHTGFILSGEEAVPSVPVLAGSTTTNHQPDVEVNKLKRGHAVVILGAAATSKEGTWVPIQPTEGEVRYLPADAIKGSPALPVAGAGRQVPIPASQAAQTVRQPTLREQADQAFEARDWNRARQLYEQAANQTSDYAEKSWCYQRLDQIVKSAPQQAPGNTTSLYRTSATGNANPPPGAGEPAAPRWSTWGKLRKTTIKKDTQPMYVLENEQGQPLIYAITYPNLSLESYVGRLVCLYGSISYGNEYVRTEYMTVSHVALP
jgi:uncharacterized protein YraI